MVRRPAATFHWRHFDCVGIEVRIDPHERFSGRVIVIIEYKVVFLALIPSSSGVPITSAVASDWGSLYRVMTASGSGKWYALFRPFSALQNV